MRSILLVRALGGKPLDTGKIIAIAPRDADLVMPMNRPAAA